MLLIDGVFNFLITKTNLFFIGLIAYLTYYVVNFWI